MSVPLFYAFSSIVASYICYACMLRERNKNVAFMTGFVVLWLSHNSIISFFLVMGGLVWRLCVWRGGGGGGVAV